jgi:anaerobic selenocysteine-containing dehydrogenase
VPRPEGARDDWEILAELSARLRGVPAKGARALRRATKDVPDRVVDLLLRAGPYRLSLAALAEAPHGVDLGALRPSRSERVRTPDGRVRLAPRVFIDDVPRLERWINESARHDDKLVLVGRRHLRSNNSWMHNLPSLTKGPSRAQLLMHPDDAARLGLAQGERVRVESRVGAVHAALAVTPDVMPGVVSLPHGFGHAAAKDTLRVAGALEGPSMNALTDDLHVEPLVGASVLNGERVVVTRAAPD